MRNHLNLFDNMIFCGDVFIIPNSLKRAREMPIMGAKLSKAIERINQMNGTEFDKLDSRCVEVWIVIPGISDNLKAHGFECEDECGRIWSVTPVMFADCLPTEIFKGKKEGDSVTITLPAVASSYDDSDPEESPFKEKEIVITLDLTLNQRDYRYRNFGSFEECLEKLLNR